MAKKKTSVRRNVDGADYEVGFAKPPLATRFKGGRSGNPKGRPKRTLTRDEEIEQMLNEKSSVRIGDKFYRISTYKLLLMQLRAKALKGDPAAMRQVLKLAERIESKKGKGNSLWDEDFEFTLDIGDKKVIGPGDPLIENDNEEDEDD